MKKRWKQLDKQSLRKESGQALILVLILLVIGSLTIIPALAVASTALKTGTNYEMMSKDLYTADAGIEDGLWRIKYDYFGPDYNKYDFTTTWEYETETVNGTTAMVEIQNVWIPTNVTLESVGLDAVEARAIIEGETIIVTGSAGAVPGQPFNIKIEYTPPAGESLVITSIGVWLPQGFTYTEGSGTLEQADPIADPYYAVPEVSTCDGGTAAVWTYSYPYPLFTSFPGVDPEETTMSAELSFSYSPPADKPNALPGGVAWITTCLEDGTDSAYPVVWDACNRVFAITSQSGDTVIEAYSSKTEMRRLGGAIQGEYVAVGNSLMINPRDNVYTTLLTSSSSTIDTIPEDADAVAAYLYWSGFRYDDDEEFSDDCSSTNLSGKWNNGGDWSYINTNPYYYRATHTGDDSRRYLTMKNSLDLGTYIPGGQYLVTWKQSILKNNVFSDKCSSMNNWNGGGAWEVRSSAYFRARSTAEENSPARLLTLASGQNINGYGKVTISWAQCLSDTGAAGDGLDIAVSADGGSTWSDYVPVFRGNTGTGWTTTSVTIPGDFDDDYLTGNFLIRFKLVGFTDSVYLCIDDITITPEFTENDGLDYSFYNGTTWSENFEAFRGDTGTEMTTFRCEIPASCVSSNFKMRFRVAGMNGSQQYVRIDEIAIIMRLPDTEVSFSINGQQVYIDSDGEPAAGAAPLVASSASIITNDTWGGFSYACCRNVSSLVKKYPIVEGEEHHTGNATYKVGEVKADTRAQVSYAGWSLIIVYMSPQSAGHYLYLYDVFSFNSQYTNLDFDGDGEPGGYIGGFTIPEPIKDKYGVPRESIAARLTAFVGEGDAWLYSTGKPNTDCIRITGQQSGISKYLSNPASPNYNVWNSASYPGTSQVGIDIDTFEIPWTDGILIPGDTKVKLDMFSGQDAWNLIYFILSVRSETVVGGTSHYIINCN